MTNPGVAIRRQSGGTNEKRDNGKDSMTLPGWRKPCRHIRSCVPGTRESLRMVGRVRTVEPEALDQFLDIRLPRGVAKLESVAKRQVLEIVRQPLGRRHLCTLNQDGNHRDIAFEGGRDFLPHEIRWTVDAASS